MQIEVVENPSVELSHFFEKKIEEFNLARWEVKEKVPIAVTIKDTHGEIIAGAGAKTFGKWLLIDNLWVSDEHRGQALGSKVLSALEQAAQKRGVQYVLLDTLNFQARPFYEKHGYLVQWTQKHYPRDGQKYFMVKELASF